jgi:hypothetical protein
MVFSYADTHMPKQRSGRSRQPAHILLILNKPPHPLKSFLGWTLQGVHFSPPFASRCRHNYSLRQRPIAASHSARSRGISPPADWQQNFFLTRCVAVLIDRATLTLVLLNIDNVNNNIDCPVPDDLLARRLFSHFPTVTQFSLSTWHPDYTPSLEEDDWKKP